MVAYIVVVHVTSINSYASLNLKLENELPRWNHACCNTNCFSEHLLWAPLLHCCGSYAYKVTCLKLNLPVVLMWVNRMVSLSDPNAKQLRFVSSSDAAFSREEEEMKEDLLNKLIHRKLMGPTLEVMDMAHPAKLPLRELPPGNTASLFMMYLAWCKVSSLHEACSKSTFYTVAKGWYTCLRFRRRSEHAMCVTCQRLKTAIHHAVDSILVVLSPIRMIWFAQYGHVQWQEANMVDPN